MASCTLPLTAQARTTLRALPGAISTFRLAVKLKSTAATAPVTRFYLDYSPASTWVALDSGAGNAGGATPLFLTGNADIQRTLISVAEPTALDLWRMANFNTYTNAGTAANDADPDKDGVGNLIGYVMNRNPQLGTGAFETSPVIGLTPQGMNAPLLADLRLLSSYDSKARVTLESSADLKDWSALGTRIGSAGSWTGLQPASSALQGGRSRFLFNTGTSPATTLKYFLRLRAEELP
jgi:hypothetical protein